MQRYPPGWGIRALAATALSSKNKGMQSRTLLIWLLLLATVLADFAVLLAARHEPWNRLLPWNSVPVVVTALRLSQVSLAAIWLALGGGPSSVRLVCVVGVTALWSLAMSIVPHAGDVRLHTLLLTAQMAAVSLPLSIARAQGVTLSDLFAAPAAGTSEPTSSAFQFSIGQLLGWTFALAVTFGTLQWIVGDVFMLTRVLREMQIAAPLAGRCAIVLAALWAALGTRWLNMRLLTLGLVGMCAFYTLRTTAASAPDGSSPLALLPLMETMLLVGSLWVFRVAGYRVRFAPRHRSGGAFCEAERDCQAGA